MHKFNEELLQFIWRHKLLKPAPLISISGNEIFVIKTGELNLDAGPDFFNAQIRINGLVLAGNIEIHIRTSDWLKHNHQQNRSYDTIILHAVYEHDVELDQNKNNNVEVLELKELISEQTIVLYEQLSTTKEKLPCAGQLRHVNELKFISWLERMTIERLEKKVERIEEWFNFYNKDYTQTFYTALLRNFGFKVNALPFELIAKHLPVQLVLKHADNLMQLEALLLGIAGLLEEQVENKYIQLLQNEFEYLKKKYQLTQLQKEIFKFSKSRPANFPTIRLAQLASMIHNASNAITNPTEFVSVDELKKTFTIDLKGYWKNHYTIDGKTLEKDLSFGNESIESIIINTYAPFFFFFAKKSGNEDLKDRALELLSACAVEINTKTKLFDSKKSVIKNAADSQALINLYDNYCSTRQCLKCGIAASILKST